MKWKTTRLREQMTSFSDWWRRNHSRVSQALQPNTGWKENTSMLERGKSYSPLQKKKKKKKMTRQTKNYSPISLLAHVYKIFTRIIQTIIKGILNENQPREQVDFRSAYSTKDHLHALNQVIEKANEYILKLSWRKISIMKKRLTLWNTKTFSQHFAKWV